MRSFSRFPRTLLAFFAATAVVALGASCSPERSTTTVTVDVLLKSQQKSLHKVGQDGRSLYGSNYLVGDGTANGEKVTVEMQAIVDYTNGGGAFDGVITLTFADGATLGLRMFDGAATAKTDTTSARFRSLLSVIDGTGTYLGTAGRGTFTGERMDAIGGAVQTHFALRLEQ
jgi:hypothetical protein